MPLSSSCSNALLRLRAADACGAVCGIAAHSAKNARLNKGTKRRLYPLVGAESLLFLMNVLVTPLVE
jgi:hypothetical protein